MISIKTKVKKIFSSQKKSSTKSKREDPYNHGLGPTSNSASGSNKISSSESPTAKLMREFDQELDVLEKDMDENFPNDPAGWMEHQIKLGLVTPKKL